MTTNGTTLQEDRTMRAIQDMAQIMERTADMLEKIATAVTAIAEKMEKKEDNE